MVPSIDTIHMSRLASDSQDASTSCSLYGCSFVEGWSLRRSGFISEAGGGEYKFKNGNLIKDPNVQSVKYNHLDLPILIVSAQGSIEIVYDADGTKLQQTETDADGNQIRTTYIGAMEYVNDQRSSLYFAGGRVMYNTTLQTPAGEERRDFVEWSISDHLGNTRIRYIDKDNDNQINVSEDDDAADELSGSYHYYPFGLVMEGNFSDHQGLTEEYQYNGIEHSSVIGSGIGLTTYRVHDAATGRWWQIDPKAEGAYSQTPYNSMFNNPISMSDPNGDFAFLAFAAIGVATNGIINEAKGNNFFDGWAGAAIGGALSGGYLSALGSGVSGHLPSANVSLGGGFNLSLSPALAFGSNGFSVGANAGVGFSSNSFNAGIGGGVGYTNMSLGANSIKGFTGSFGGGASIEGSNWSAGLYSNGTSGMGTGQQVGGFRATLGGASITYENDGAPFPPWSGINDAKDRFRTNAVSIGYGGWDARLNMFTGNSYGITDVECSDCLIAGHPTKGLKTGDGDMYRLGALSIGYNGHRAGWNSEGIRHLFQNKFAHTRHNALGLSFLKDQGYFRHLGGRGGFYSEISTYSNPYSLWSF